MNEIAVVLLVGLLTLVALHVASSGMPKSGVSELVIAVVAEVKASSRRKVGGGR